MSQARSYMNAHMLSQKIVRQGYYWTTMEVDCVARLEVPSKRSPRRSETHATHAITYYDTTLAIFYMGDRYYWEDSLDCIQWP